MYVKMRWNGKAVTRNTPPPRRPDVTEHALDLSIKTSTSTYPQFEKLPTCTTPRKTSFRGSFSIDSILSHKEREAKCGADVRNEQHKREEMKNIDNDGEDFGLLPRRNRKPNITLPLTRYPQLSRNKEGCGQYVEKRRLVKKERRKRTIFTPRQLLKLEEFFMKHQHVIGQERKVLAESLNLTEVQVKVWFQNRRMKCRHHPNMASSSDEQDKFGNDVSMMTRQDCYFRPQQEDQCSNGSGENASSSSGYNSICDSSY